MKNNVILSLFPGLGLLDIGFIEHGYIVLRGPDVIYGTLHDIKQFHPPPGLFEGIIGGPPCQAHSILQYVNKKKGNKKAEDLIPEFTRCIVEAEPEWFLMENVPRAPSPNITGYTIQTFTINNRLLKDSTPQNRVRRFWFGLRGNIQPDILKYIEYSDKVSEKRENTVTASGQFQGSRLSTKKSGSNIVKKSLVLQGLPENFFDTVPLTVSGKQRLIGNAVPLPMSRAIAKAICKYKDEIKLLETK
ncbi:MAG: hypothetical protein HPY87_09010 [Fervidobacterium sp.]|uniref:DNA cytosine methyltransferase n=1 Tax=Fervidobacterium sp. TaxID=1871331 RepID=UPI0025BEE83E|nr:DNA cytosine methyltransferase [Fervidobacterium sp.]NPU90000.1 hypothetical protein [Fervidobacterium sp.]